MHKDIWKVAKQFRLDAFSYVQKTPGLNNWNEIGSLIDELKVVLPEKINEKVISLNLQVTDRALEQVLFSNEMTMFEKVLVANHVLELYPREVFELSGAIVKNLTSSKTNGYFFSPLPVVECLAGAYEHIENSVDKRNICDPSMGGGVVLSYLMLTKNDIASVTGIEKDPFTCLAARKILEYIAKERQLDVKINILNHDSTDFLFNNDLDESFDLVIGNPPYGRIKHLSDIFKNKETESTLNDADLDKLNQFLVDKNKALSKKLKLVLKDYGLDSGTLEFSKVFWGIAFKLAKPHGVISFITPNSWLGDKSSSNFREFVFHTSAIKKVVNIKENAKFFQTVNQPTVITHIVKSEKVSSLSFVGPVSKTEDFNNDPYIINVDDLLITDTELKRIPFNNVEAYQLYKKLSFKNKIKDNAKILNQRGECDLTLFKSCIKQSQSKDVIKLIRGDHLQVVNVSHYSIPEKQGYLDLNAFKNLVGDSPKLEHIFSNRIACPQCSYLDKKKRMYWSLIPVGSSLANSANYIKVENEDKGLSLLLVSLLISLNSRPVEWFFRYFNSNNHIGNFEIDELPYFILSDEDFEVASNIVRTLLNSNSPEVLQEEFLHFADTLSIKYFELSNSECVYLGIADTARLNLVPDQVVMEGIYV